MLRYVLSEMKPQICIVIVGSKFVDNHNIGDYHDSVGEYFVGRYAH